jgi:ABC-type uncharacterized transport system substrate-binding protein
MKKTTLLSILVVAVQLTIGVVAEAQQPKKVSRIGYLSSRDPDSDSAHSEAVRLGLRERGYIEGQNIAIEYRFGGGKAERFAELAAELVRHKVDIIVAAVVNAKSEKKCQYFLSVVPHASPFAVVIGPSGPVFSVVPAASVISSMIS